MSWRRYSRSITWYSIWKGLYTQEPLGDIPHNPRKGESFLYQANNVYAPGISTVLRKIPGFTRGRSLAVNANGIVTGMVHMGEISDEFLLSVSIAGTSHNFYRDNANPPGAIAGGTNFTIGSDNLVSWVLFTDGTNPGAIAFSRQRDTPQFFNSSVTRSNFSISSTTLPQFGDVFGQRLLLGAPSVSGTIYDDRVYWTDIRDGDSISDINTQFASFETTEKDRVRAIKKISDVCLVGKLNNVFLLAVTPSAINPYAIRELPAGRYRGPVSHQGVVEADSKLFWMGQTNIHSLDLSGRVLDVADQIKPTIESLDDGRRDVTVAGVDAVRNLIVFNVSDSGQTTNALCIVLNYKTGAIYLRTITRNAYAQRLVSEEHRLIGGGYSGFFYNEFTGTSGNADDSTAVIDGDIFTPRFWVSYGSKAKIPFVLVSLDPIASEQLTVQYRLDDDTTWSTPSESPVIVSNTDTDTLTIAVVINAWAERIQLRFRNNRADEAFSIKAVGIPGLLTQPVVA